jgi:hypothetical protein
VAGFEHAELASVAPQIGVRETRRIEGERVLHESAVLHGEKDDTGIALGAWPVEIHDPATGTIGWKYLETEDDYYAIPLGCLIPKGIENLITAGRCISTTHVAQASTRVIAQALAMGQAAGILAARVAATKDPSGKVPPEAVRKGLREGGAILEA